MTFRECAAVFAGALLLACLMFWPLPLHLSTQVAKDAGDPLLQAWQVAWDGHALLRQPLDFWQSNLFYPANDSLAFSDALVGYLPAGLIGSGPHAALARYNALFLLVYALSVAGPYVLGRELGLARGSAVIAGLAFAYSPWRWEQSGHLHIISSGTIALAIALPLRGYRRGSAKATVAGWAVVAWQVLIGVSLGLLLLYLLVVLTVVAAAVWWRAGRPRPERPVVIATGAGIALVAVALALIAPPYLRVKDDYPEAKRDLATVQTLSPPLKAFVTTSAANTVWGTATKSTRETLPAPAEQTLFPGLTIVLLALAGLTGGSFSKRLRLGLAAAALLAFLFSLGLRLDDGRLTYRLLYDHVPGFDGIRTPGRLHTFTTLALALLAGAGAQRLARRRAAVVVAVLAVLILAEGSSLRATTPDQQGTWAFASHPAVPEKPAGLDGADGPLLQLPPGEPDVYRYIVWSTDGFPRMVNGLSGFEPSVVKAIKAAAQTFPDPASTDALRAAGVRTVVAHAGAIPGTPWADLATRPLTGLRVTRRIDGDVIRFDLQPRQADAK